MSITSHAWECAILTGPRFTQLTDSVRDGSTSRHTAKLDNDWVDKLSVIVRMVSPFQGLAHSLFGSEQTGQEESRVTDDETSLSTSVVLGGGGCDMTMMMAASPSAETVTYRQKAPEHSTAAPACDNEITSPSPPLFKGDASPFAGSRVGSPGSIMSEDDPLRRFYEAAAAAGLPVGDREIEQRVQQKFREKAPLPYQTHTHILKPHQIEHQQTSLMRTTANSMMMADTMPTKKTTTPFNWGAAIGGASRLWPWGTNNPETIGIPMSPPAAAAAGGGNFQRTVIRCDQSGQIISTQEAGGETNNGGGPSQKSGSDKGSSGRAAVFLENKNQMMNDEVNSAAAADGSFLYQQLNPLPSARGSGEYAHRKIEKMPSRAELYFSRETIMKLKTERVRQIAGGDEEKLCRLMGPIATLLKDCETSSDKSDVANQIKDRLRAILFVEKEKALAKSLGMQPGQIRALMKEVPSVGGPTGICLSPSFLAASSSSQQHQHSSNSSNGSANYPPSQSLYGEAEQIRDYHQARFQKRRPTPHPGYSAFSQGGGGSDGRGLGICNEQLITNAVGMLASPRHGGGGGGAASLIPGFGARVDVNAAFAQQAEKGRRKHQQTRSKGMMMPSCSSQSDKTSKYETPRKTTMVLAAKEYLVEENKKTKQSNMMSQVLANFLETVKMPSPTTSAKKETFNCSWASVVDMVKHQFGKTASETRDGDDDLVAHIKTERAAAPLKNSSTPPGSQPGTAGSLRAVARSGNMTTSSITVSVPSTVNNMSPSPLQVPGMSPSAAPSSSNPSGTAQKKQSFLQSRWSQQQPGSQRISTISPGAAWTTPSDLLRVQPFPASRRILKP